MTGNIVMMAIKTGTHRLLNQIRASRMKVITGVERNTTSIGLTNELKFAEVPAKIPTNKATINETRKPKSPRETVADTEKIKSAEKMIFTRSIATFSGGGRMNGEFIKMEITFHTSSIKTTDETANILFVVKKVFIWNFPSNDIRV
jgi:hypothetical protein